MQDFEFFLNVAREYQVGVTAVGLPRNPICVWDLFTWEPNPVLQGLFPRATKPERSPSPVPFCFLRAKLCLAALLETPPPRSAASAMRRLHEASLPCGRQHVLFLLFLSSLLFSLSSLKHFSLLCDSCCMSGVRVVSGLQNLAISFQFDSDCLEKDFSCTLSGFRVFPHVYVVYRVQNF